MPSRTTRFRMPSTQRNTPDTDAPTMPVAECRPDPWFLTSPTSVFTPRESRKVRLKTTVEGPEEDQKPIEDGLRPPPLWVVAEIRLGVVLLAAAMLAALKACPRPKV